MLNADYVPYSRIRVESRMQGVRMEFEANPIHEIGWYGTLGEYYLKGGVISQDNLRMNLSKPLGQPGLHHQ